MRICFYNPQTVGKILGLTLVESMFERQKASAHNRRLNFLMRLLRDKKYDTAIVVDGTASSFPFARLGPLFNNYYFIRAFAFFEVYLWCMVNKINPFRQTIIFSFNRLKPASDILFGFAYFGRTFFDDAMTTRSFFTRFTGKKILHATHFYGKTKVVADNVKRTGTTIMIAEADLTRSTYFKKHFGFIKTVGILPFPLRSRYVSRTEFLSRKNKCLALGNLEIFPAGHPPVVDHFAHFKADTLHPMRKAIFENSAKLAAAVDSKIIAHQSGNIGKAQVYHSFNIVDAYNEYRMFVAPEENIGLPSVNCVEGMGCGCAFVGLDDPMYADLGFKKGVHYIPYDGTIDGLAHTVEHYQKHPAELAAIAAAGHAFVTEHLQEDTVLDNFVKTLQTI